MTDDDAKTKHRRALTAAALAVQKALDAHGYGEDGPSFISALALACVSAAEASKGAITLDQLLYRLGRQARDIERKARRSGDLNH